MVNPPQLPFNRWHSSSGRSPGRLLWGALAMLPLVVATPPILGQEISVPLSARLQTVYFQGVPETLDDLRLMDAHQRELAERVMQVTVAVQVGPTQGSGVIIRKDGYVLTAAHVAGQPDLPVRITLADGREYRGRTLGMNRNMDAGLIKILPRLRDGDPLNFPYARMGDASRMQPGSWCMALGHPGGYKDGRQPVVRLGRVLSNSKSEMQTDCELVGGDSGGPLFDMEGFVVGIHSRIGSQLSKNLHVPVNTFREDWDRLANSESWGSLSNLIGKPMIGVYGVKDSTEARIAQVAPGSPAESAGIKAGDLVTRFAGKKIATFQDLASFVRQHKPGDRVDIEVLRASNRLKLSVVIGASREAP